MIHGHWTTTDGTATIVMPTGTGKTETMLSILVSMSCPRLLVVVPTDALRTQLAAKFLTLGLLKDMRVVAGSALYPIVGMLMHSMTSVDSVDAFFERCNVVVTTAQIAGRCGGAVQERIAHQCPYLFIDEAHHVAAATWHALRRDSGLPNCAVHGDAVPQRPQSDWREDHL
jgi:superfamily II DNA or RNA helicase